MAAGDEDCGEQERVAQEDGDEERGEPIPSNVDEIRRFIGIANDCVGWVCIGS
jgi:hypothetical protein